MGVDGMFPAWYAGAREQLEDDAMPASRDVVNDWTVGRGAMGTAEYGVVNVW